MISEEFVKLGLSKEILNVLDEKDFEKPSKIQERSIPPALAGKDIIGGSATGSGKTLVFSSPIIDNLKPNNSIQALILTPTRELAEQISGVMKNFSKNKKLNVLSIYGGTSIENQIRKIPKADVIVGTPGRIIDHLNRKTLKFNKVKFLVLDEVDRMFDMGFIYDVEKILKECPRDKQTMMFSATISSNMDYFAKKYTKDAVEISVDSYVDPSKLRQIFYDVKSSLKFSLLVHLLKKENSNLVMVFCNTRRNVDFIADNLKKLGIHSKAIHGGLPQNKRKRVMDEFHRNDTMVNVLICTDVAARGLDIKGVSHVYNYDTPSTREDYLHRIGRTARAGESGIAITILSSRDYDNFRKIMDRETLNIKQEEVPRIERIILKKDNRNNNRRNRNFNRNSRYKNSQKRHNRFPRSKL